MHNVNEKRNGTASSVYLASNIYGRSVETSRDTMGALIINDDHFYICFTALIIHESYSSIVSCIQMPPGAVSIQVHVCNTG